MREHTRFKYDKDTYLYWANGIHRSDSAYVYTVAQFFCCRIDDGYFGHRV